MRNYLLLIPIFLFSSLYSQEYKNELTVSFLSLGDNTYPINGVMYRRTINENVKLRAMLSSEIYNSVWPEVGMGCADCGMTKQTASGFGVSAGAQYGKHLNRFNPYGYLDFFYSENYKTDEVWNLGTDRESQMEVTNKGVRAGLGLAFDVTPRLAIAWEPSYSISLEKIRGEERQRDRYISLNQERIGTEFRPINVIGLSIKF